MGGTGGGSTVSCAFRRAGTGEIAFFLAAYLVFILKHVLFLGLQHRMWLKVQWRDTCSGGGEGRELEERELELEQDGRRWQEQDAKWKELEC